MIGYIGENSKKILGQMDFYNTCVPHFENVFYHTVHSFRELDRQTTFLTLPTAVILCTSTCGAYRAIKTPCGCMPGRKRTFYAVFFFA